MKGWKRSGSLLILFGVLAVSLVAFGSVMDVPQNSIRLQETTSIITDTEPHLGDRVVVDGAVLGTDPVVIQVEGETTDRVQVTESSPTDLSVGDQAYVFGTLTAPNTVRADRVVVQTPGDRRYMFLVSFLATLIISGRLINHWQLDTGRWLLVPRNETPASGGTDD